jgi:hypothetical protein
MLPQFSNPPGYVPVQANVQMLRGKGNPLSHFSGAPTVEKAIEAGIMMAGGDETGREILRPCRRFRPLASHGPRRVS